MIAVSVKPNETKSANKFDDESVKHQVAYLGLVENVRVRRAGFAYRISYDNFLTRYKLLEKSTWPNPKNGVSAENAVKAILGPKIAENDCSFGKTKLFIKPPDTILKFEQDRRDKINNYIAPLINRLWRGAIARKRCRQIRAVNKIVGTYRRYKLKSYIQEMLNVFVQASQLDYKNALKYGTENWPNPPVMLKKLSKKFLSYFRGWCCRGVLSSIQPSEYEFVKLRCEAFGYLKGKRAFQGTKVDGQPWKLDYVSDQKFRVQSAAVNSKMGAGAGAAATTAVGGRTPAKQQAENQIKNFTCKAIRLNQKGKFYERIISANSKGLYKMDPKNFKVLGGKRKDLNNTSTTLPDGCYSHSSLKQIKLTNNQNCPLLVLEYPDGPLILAMLEGASSVEFMAFLTKVFKDLVGRPFALPNVVVESDGIKTKFGKSVVKISSVPRNAEVEGGVKFEKVRGGFTVQFESKN